MAELAAILGVSNDARLPAFQLTLRALGEDRRRTIQAMPFGYSIAPFDMSLTKRMEWLRTHVVAPAETLLDSLSVENRPHFSDWPGYRFLRRRPHLDELRTELAALRRHARSLYFSMLRQLEDGAPHNSEMRYDIVGSLIDLLAEHFPEIPRTRGQYDKALGFTVGRTPDS